MSLKTLMAVCFATMMTVAAFIPIFRANPPSDSLTSSEIEQLAATTRGFPDKDPDSGKFLGQAGINLSTLAGQENALYIAIPAGRSEFTLSIFDGDNGDHWDAPNFSVDTLDYKLYKDPMKTGANVLLDSWTNAGLLDDDWSARKYSTSADAMAPSGNYFYRIEVNWRFPNSADDMAGFKLKVDGQLSVVRNQAFCVEGAPLNFDLDPDLGSGDPNPGDQNDPNANSYQGYWLFYFYVPVKVDTMKFRDGDFDRAGDTDDPNTPNTDPDGPGPAQPEGVNDGQPADDGQGITVPPSVIYKVTDPSGNSFTNNNPSGNQEWENFIISDLTSENPDYLTSKTLLPGLWKVEIVGLDAHNLACLSAPYEVFPTDDPPLPLYPPPKVEPDRQATVYVPPAQTLDFAHNVTNQGAAQVFDLAATSVHGWKTRIYHDLDGDRNLDPGEPLVNDTGTLVQNSTYKLIVQVDVPALLSDTVDVTTVRASSQLEWAVQGTVIDTITAIANRPPVANAAGPYSTYENTPIMLDGRGSNDPDNDILQYRWDFENDGVWDTAWGASPTVWHTWGDDWQGDISLEVSDGQFTDKATAGVSVLSVLPSGTIKIVDYQMVEGGPITVSVHITDPGSDDIIIIWSWGDGTPDEYEIYYNNGASPDPYPSYDINPRDVNSSKVHVYGDNGAFEVNVVVTDDDCPRCAVPLTATATPANLPPSVDVSGGTTIDEGQSVALTATATDPGSDDLTFKWYWGDGTSESRTYFNNGVGPDPPQSPGGTFPFTAVDSANHPYGDNGLFNLTLTVEDDDGGYVTHAGQIIVMNLPPTIQPFGPYTSNEGSAFTSSAIVSDSGSDDLTFSWSFELGAGATVTYFNDGSSPDPYPSPGPVYPFTASDTQTRTYGDNGGYAITLTVTDDDGGSSSYSTSVTVVNLAPSISPFGPFTADEGSPFNVSATATDPGSDDLQFSWSFELGSTIQNMHCNDGVNPDPAKSPWGGFPFYATDTATSTYGDNAAYTLVLTVTDDDGGSNSYSTQVTVANIAPTIAPFGPFTLNEGSQTSPTATASDAGSDDLTFIWTFELGPTIQNPHYNDGSAPDPAKSPWGTFPFTATDPVAHTYGDNGVYSVSLIVKDDDGAQANYSTTITVMNLPPEIEPFGPYFVDEGQPVTISADASDQGSDDLTFSWTFELGPNLQMTYFNNGVSPDPVKSPNGTFPFTATDSPSHTYGDNGVYAVTLVVTDDDGGSATYSTQIIVDNLAPDIEDFGPYQVNEGSELTAGTTVTDPGSDDLIFTWTWELGPTTQSIYYNDGANPDPDKSPWGTFPFSANDSAGHTYGDNGVYTLYLVVEDDDGGVTDYMTDVTVDNVAPTIEPFGPHEIDEGSPITLQASATDVGSDDLTFTWSFEYGPTYQQTFYNDGANPDPDKSPWGTFPFSAQSWASWTYGDNGVFKVTLTVEDDDGGITTYETTVTVNNVAPTIDQVQAYVIANITLRVAGEKWHDVCMNLVHNGNVESAACVVRYSGSPDDQSVTIVGRIQLIGDFKIVLYYTPDDDPINGQPNGANPAWVTIKFPSGDEVRLHHTFNVRHPDTWVWTLDDIRPYLVGQEITFNATASDVGSDDLTFTWSWSDGTPDAFATYFNDGTGPDPYPSPNGTFPFTATDVAKHTYSAAGTYTVTLAVNDDDGGVVTYTFDITVGG